MFGELIWLTHQGAIFRCSGFARQGSFQHVRKARQGPPPLHSSTRVFRVYLQHQCPWRLLLDEACRRRHTGGCVEQLDLVSLRSVECRRAICLCRDQGSRPLVLANFAMEIALRGIRVKTVSPGPIETPGPMKAGMQPAHLASIAEQLLPLGSIEQPKNVGSVALFFGFNDCSFVTDGHRLRDNRLVEI